MSGVPAAGLRNMALVEESKKRELIDLNFCGAN